MHGTDVKARPRAVEKFLAQVARPEETHEELDDAFQEARARSREALMLDLVLKDGTIDSFDYTSLRRVIYQPNEGVLKLRFGRDEVQVRGRNMKRLRELITEHRRRFIKEGTQAQMDLASDDAEQIDAIEITEGVED